MTTSGVALNLVTADSWQAVKKIQKNRPKSDKLDLRLAWMERALQGAIRASGKDRENIRGIYYEEVDDD